MYFEKVGLCSLLGRRVSALISNIDGLNNTLFVHVTFKY